MDCDDARFRLSSLDLWETTVASSGVRRRRRSLRVARAVVRPATETASVCRV